MELVAIFMPMKPASMENTPPVTKAKGVNFDSIFPPEANAMIRSAMNTTTNTLNTVVYCCLRYALAPARMDAAILRIFSVPSE